MTTIYKYPLTITGWQVIELPQGAEILCAQTQGDDPQMWVWVDTDAQLEPRELRLYGTGFPIDGTIGQRYISTFQDGSLVWHLFETI